MYFLLKSEIKANKNNFCPTCFKTQIKKLDKKASYNKYKCWNKDCKDKNEPFIIINDYIVHEDAFNLTCESCHDHLTREIKIQDDDIEENIVLTFKCMNKMCEIDFEVFQYNLSKNHWEGKTPKLRLYEDQIINIENKGQTKNKSQDESVTIKKPEGPEFKSDKIPIKDIANVDRMYNTYEVINTNSHVEDMPLLTMNAEDYEKFLSFHNNKVVVLIDVPNFVRGLREQHKKDFINIVKKAHDLLVKSISNLYTADEFIIRYFSNPDIDLKPSNDIIMDYCRKNQNTEFLHLLRMMKGRGFSDIDNYIIANSIEILERCHIKGFMIVSSDKDYLPVMRIASYKNVKSYIMGTNTSTIYEQYDIINIKFLGIMKFFNSVQTPHKNEPVVKNNYTNNLNCNKNAKNVLQEYCQKKGLPIPEYDFVDKQLFDNKSIYTVETRVKAILNGNIKAVSAKGKMTSSKAAEFIAAEKLCDMLGLIYKAKEY